ncbi:MAG: CHRD domain-containing protein [Ilumatobacteraceae bacterium]
MSTTLTPEAEVDPFVGPDGASGEISLRPDPGRQQVCVELSTEGFDLVLAHIHEAPVGENGPVVVDFTELIDGDGASGCVTVDRATIVEIISGPADYYVNLHEGVPPTDGFFSAIRGQLGR